MNWPKGKPRGLKAEIPVGKRFNRLTVLGRDYATKGRVKWICVCDCGSEYSAAACDIKRGHTQSCGCANQESRVVNNTRHGYNRTATYVVWSNMHARCSNPNRKEYKNYGGRGISVCERWNEFQNFLDDMGEKPPRLSIDRINNDGNYEPTNCRWATASQQRQNQRPRSVVRAAASIGQQMEK